jgi:hypothetical protein
MQERERKVTELTRLIENLEAGHVTDRSRDLARVHQLSQALASRHLTAYDRGTANLVERAERLSL